jgi:hypothetical protein
VNEFGTELDWDGGYRVVQREDASTDPFTRFQYDELDPRSMEQARGFEAGDARTQNCDLYSCRLHDVPG